MPDSSSARTALGAAPELALASVLASFDLPASRELPSCDKK
jgi:hypothetical protein